MPASTSPAPRSPLFIGLALVANLILLAGCTPQWRLTEDRVDTLLDRVEESWPMCHTPAAGTAQPAAPSERSTGSCGGTLSATYEHYEGDTDWTVTLDDLCLDSEDGKVILDGVVTAFEKGMPSEHGPIHESVEVGTDGPVELMHRGSTAEVELGSLSAEFGYPDVHPGVPDEAHPDQVMLDELLLTNLNDEGRKDFVRDVRIERTGGDIASFRVLDGRLGTDHEGYVALRTSEDDPIVLDILHSRYVSGSVELHGAGDTVLVATPDPDRQGVYSLTLNGEAHAREVDCSAAAEPITQAIFAFLVVAPIF